MIPQTYHITCFTQILESLTLFSNSVRGDSEEGGHQISGGKSRSRRAPTGEDQRHEECVNKMWSEGSAWPREEAPVTTYALTLIWKSRV